MDRATLNAATNIGRHIRECEDYINSLHADLNHVNKGKELYVKSVDGEMALFLEDEDINTIELILEKRIKKNNQLLKKLYEELEAL